MSIQSIRMYSTFCSIEELKDFDARSKFLPRLLDARDHRDYVDDAWLVFTAHRMSRDEHCVHSSKLLGSGASDLPQSFLSARQG